MVNNATNINKSNNRNINMDSTLVGLMNTRS